MLDPADDVQVRAAISELLDREHPGGTIVGPLHRVTAATSTWVWFLEFGGAVPDDWRGPQVLRIFGPTGVRTAEMEQRLCDRLADQRFPAARTRWRGELAPESPALLQERLSGRPAAEVLASLRLPKIVRSLGALQAQLHGIDPEGLPLRQLSPSAYLDIDLGRRRAGLTTDDPSGIWEWLLRTADSMERPQEQWVLCHGDLHPLNALVADDGAISLVDWTDACVADRHHDVGRTVAMYWAASVLTDSTAERVALKALRNWLGRTHRAAYEATARTTLDDTLLNWWQVVHLYRGWLQLSEIAEGVVHDQGSSTIARLPAGLSDVLLGRCAELRRTIDLRRTSER